MKSKHKQSSRKHWLGETREQCARWKIGRINVQKLTLCKENLNQIKIVWKMRSGLIRGEWMEKGKSRSSNHNKLFDGKLGKRKIINCRCKRNNQINSYNKNN